MKNKFTSEKYVHSDGCYDCFQSDRTFVPKPSGSGDRNRRIGLLRYGKQCLCDFASDFFLQHSDGCLKNRSERLALKQYENAQRVFHGALIYAAIVGRSGCPGCIFRREYLLAYNQQNALPALQVLAPTIFLSAILGVLRGDISGAYTMVPTSISQILEQIANAIVSHCCR